MKSTKLRLPNWTRWVQHTNNANAYRDAVPVKMLTAATRRVDPDRKGVAERQVYYYMLPGIPSQEKMATEVMQLRTAVLIAAALKRLRGVELTLRDFDVHGIL